VLPYLKKVKYFYTTETFFSKTRQFACCFLTEHPIYAGYMLSLDLKHDAQEIFSIKSNNELQKLLFATPVKMRTTKANRTPLILKPDDKWVLSVEDEYSAIGHETLSKRADYIIKNRNEIAERVQTIIKDKFDEKNMDQSELLPEQKIFALKPDRNQQDLMNNFVLSDNMDEKVKIYKNFDGDLKHLSELILIDEYGKEAFEDKEYLRIRKGISKRLLSTNNEPFPTIPAQFERIDTLRMEESESEDKKKLEIVENINDHLTKLSTDHEKYL